MNKSIVIVACMIYKSTIYLDFIINQLNKYAISDKYTVKYMIVANNPNQDVCNKLKNENITHLIYMDHDPNDFYMNRVYRCWNFSGFNAQGDIIVFVNSDMGFSDGWLDNLLSYLNESTIPCSRLVESGKLISGKYGISKNFGKTPIEYKEDEFLAYARSINIDKYYEGGLFMPVAFYKEDFVKSGGYPEGNIYQSGIGKFNTPFVESGDSYFFYKNEIMKKKTHITVFSSIVYHIQEGELDS